MNLPSDQISLAPALLGICASDGAEFRVKERLLCQLRVVCIEHQVEGRILIEG